MTNTYSILSPLNRVRTQVYGYYSLLWPDQLHRLMSCVTSNARMANSTPSCLGAAVPIIFHKSPLVAVILAGLSHHPLLVSASIGIAAFTPLVCSFIVSFLPGTTCFNIEAFLVPITLVLQLTGRMQQALSLASHTALVLMRLTNSYFFFLFCLGVILIYSPRSYEAGAFLDFGPAWTASGLGQ